MPHLIVIYGAPLTGKSSLAREVAQALGDKTAVVSTDAMLDDAIVSHDSDTHAELEMVHTQARLLVANYLKNRYNVVLEGAFSYERNGSAYEYEREIDQVLALMRNLAWSPLVVRLQASVQTLGERAQASQRARDVDAAVRIDSAYRRRYGNGTTVVSTDDVSVPVLAEEVLSRLRSASG